jgi:hypothetical protein
MHWHFIIEELDPAFNYIKGPKNIVADTLSCLYLIEPKAKQEIKYMAEYYGIQANDIIFPLTYPNIQKNNLPIIHYNKLLLCILIIICTPFVGLKVQLY